MKESLIQYARLNIKIDLILCEFIILNQMAKKGKATKEDIEVESEEGGNSATAKEGDKKEQYFECKCGRKYGSLAAVHTHINNKHSEDKKGFKQGIINPKKNGQGPSTSIRMKDISFDEQQADLMCAADTTLKNIFDFISKHDEETKQKTHFLLDQTVVDSQDELDDDEDFDTEYRRNGKRDTEVNQRLQALKENYNITFINAIIKDAQEFETFKINKFNLAMIRELIKFFNPLFASRIQLELEIIATKNRHSDKRTLDKLAEVEKEMWGDKFNICEILNQYFYDWISLRGKEYKMNSGSK